MPFVKTDIRAEKQKTQKLIDSDPELKAYAEELDKEYEFRQKLIMARKQSTQKE